MKHLGLGLTLCFALLMVGCVGGGSETNVPNTDISVNTDVEGPPEVQVQDLAEPETTTDIASEDTADSGSDIVVSEDFGKGCGSDDDCQNGPCVQTANGSVCSQECEDVCPEGWSCYPQKEGAEGDSVCFPDYATLCMPCSANSDCVLSGGLGNDRCIPRGDEGSYCGGSCNDTDCPAGYACEEIADVNGEVSRQCVKEEGPCECSLLAKSTQASTSCLLTNEFGSCPGERQCSGSGLSDCEGEEASAELCDGLDNDCSEATLDGSGDPSLGGVCDGEDIDGCEDGTFSCVDGTLVCVDPDGDAIELCDGIDNDCDPETLDGSSDPALADACDGDDSDLCADGTGTCVDGAIVCVEDGEAKLDICDGLDNDCNPETQDGADDASLGASCDGDDVDLCNNGVTVCMNGELACEEGADNVIDMCDGLDNDCDPETPDGAGDASVGLFCDGDDKDSCADGMTQCVNGAIVCVDPDDALVDLCDGVDNDCDPTTEDGSNDPAIGQPCDGEDADLCQEGVAACVGGVLICDEPDDLDLELCDGIDNDCNPATEDGSDEETFGLPCDGEDDDLCEEGVNACIDAAMVCNDPNTLNVELCDGEDNDCDPATVDGQDEPTLYQSCDGEDIDLCEEGQNVCIAGELLCNDPNELSEEVCDNVDNDCDGVIDEDFPNTDGTGLADCLDDDDDDDGVVDDMDCAPLDPAIFPSCVNKQCGDNGCGADCGACDAKSLCIDNQCVCQPNCDGKVCGDDGCGGSCGGCDAPTSCQDGQCVCTPNCNGKQCGDNGCGGSCGGCPGGQVCSGGTCVTPCVPQCVGKTCGPDGCGGLCGVCGANDGSCINGNCCAPNCNGAQCGSDGCGGSCGSCGGNTACVGNQCVCQPNCNGAQCGGDGCGGSCGVCSGNTACVGNQCVCQPNCNGKQCGGDGCGGSCGVCGGNTACVGNQCVCQPNCNGKTCGDDGCGGSCGSCKGNTACVGNQCVCQPNCDGKQCGSDGCGGSCGACVGIKSCVNNQCVCTPQCNGVQCGSDGCGGSCGSCKGNESCAGGQCVCQPNCNGKVCGGDGCGGSCGACKDGKVCSASGTSCDCPATCAPGAAKCIGAAAIQYCIQPEGQCPSWSLTIQCPGGCVPSSPNDVCNFGFFP